MKKLILIIVFFSAFFSLPAVSAIDSFKFENEAQENTFRNLTHVLRCPKCQNQNISDSNAPLAKDLRTKTYDLILQGKTEDEILEYMTDRFGNFILYDPPMTIATIFLWVGPLFFIILGFGYLFFQVKRQGKKESSLEEQDALRLQRILNANNVETKSTEDRK
ncbi:cytochrome C biogenesis protein [Psychromonas sp. CNPT3]|uniref:cytochrome c-type biogenesis protein n=1 Tax=Psychromonas sp. CNPT3 TaxID=314282 RepID=UPI00006E78EC|nr:cytochrome c-type biogenesis protein [Psychromonas sp. CNPT3]AGH82023.1 cytochrome C biogenesis protein [Psychromonas sp. CNPT3]